MLGHSIARGTRINNILFVTAVNFKLCMIEEPAKN